MKSILSICSITLLFLIAASPVGADIAKPKPAATAKQEKRVMQTVIEIVPDAKAYEARLLIQESDLNDLRAALNSAAGDRSIATAITRSSTRTIIAGMLLFLSISSAGVWLIRSHRNPQLQRARRAVAAIVIGVATIGAAAIITRGNAGPPGYYRWKNLPQALSQGRAMTGSVEIIVVPDDAERGRYMKLIIPLRNSSKQGEDE